MVVIAMFGSRHGYDPNKIRSVLLKLKQRFGDRLTIHVGDCKGVDETVYRLCKELGIKVRVFMVANNPIGYRPDPSDVFNVLDEPDWPLRLRLATRTFRLFYYTKLHNGGFIGFNTKGKGSRLMLRYIKDSYPPQELKKRLVVFD